MAMKALKCPNCDANIQVDGSLEYGFCSYCGAQIQIKDVVEVYSAEEFDSARFMKLMEDSQAFLKLGNHLRAEEGFMEMIRLYPGKAIGYERLICAITHDYMLFPLENAERLQTLKKKMMLVCEEDEKEHYMEICKRVDNGFADPKFMGLPSEKTVKLAKMREKFKASVLITVFSIFMGILIEEPAKKSLMLSLLGILLCLLAIWCGITAIVTKVKIDNMAEEEKGE